MLGEPSSVVINIPNGLFSTKPVILLKFSSANFSGIYMIFLCANAKLSARPKEARLFATAKTVTFLGVRWSALLAYGNC